MAGIRPSRAAGPVSLATHLLRTLDDERRGIAQFLHAATGQHMAALQINLSLMGQESGLLSQRGVRALADCTAIAQGCASQLQQLSYSLHPPLLDEVGLAAAVQSEIEDFVKRTTTQISIETSPLPRLPADVEICLFRVLREGLRALERMRARRADVRFLARSGFVELDLITDGGAISADTLGPAILQEMRQRARQIGARLVLRSAGRGSRLRMTLPVRKARAARA